MKDNPEELFDQLLQELKKGKNIDECVKKVPEHDELKDLLAIAHSIASLPVPEPREQAVAETLRRVRAVSSREKQKRPFFLRQFTSWQPVLVRAAAVIILIIAISWTTTSLSAHSLPGEPLYPVKRLTERIEYSVAFDAHRKAVLHLRFANRRTQEFSDVFAPGEKIDRSLLSAMLNEIQSAFQYAGQCSERHCAALMQGVADYNNYQRQVLETARARACDCDREILGRAISVCQERQTCLECMPTDTTFSNTSAPCWNNECRFE